MQKWQVCVEVLLSALPSLSFDLDDLGDLASLLGNG